jgi:hypothetical protein
MSKDLDEVRRGTWIDVNRDSFPDMVLSYAPLAWDYGTGQEIWVNAGPAGGGLFERWGDERAIVPNPAYHPVNNPNAPPLLFDLSPIEEWSPVPDQVAALIRTSFFTTRLGGGVGDWDGDGWTDLAYTGVLSLSEVGPVVLHRFTNGAALPGDLLPGFSTHSSSAPSEFVAVNTAADVLNAGRQQWLGSKLADAVFRPFFRLLAENGNSGLAEYSQEVLNVEARIAGVLDAVDVNSDGRLDLLHSGFQDGGELGTQFYRNRHLIINTPPSAPGGLTADANPARVRFSWNMATDAQTPAVALRYALKLMARR